MTRSGRTVLVVEVEVLADLVEDALNDLVDDGLLAGRVGVLVSPSPAVRGAKARKDPCPFHEQYIRWLEVAMDGMRNGGERR